MNLFPIFALAISFFSTIVFLPIWIRKLKEINFLWEDMNKPGYPRKVVASGGIIAIMSFVISVLYYIAMRTFYVKSAKITLQILALLCVILIYAMIGLVDDFFGWRKKGLSIRFRLAVALIGSIPLVVINAGVSSMNFPFIGGVQLGLLYPLFFVPIGIAGATTTYNFLAGFNGLEASQGIIILSFLSYVSYVTGSPWLTLVGMTMVFSLIAFYFYNKFPAKVFPGDSLTWSIGALIAMMAILGNFEKIAVVIFIPYILETILKLRGGLKKHSFAEPNSDGSLKMKYNKIYGLTHFSVWFLSKFKKKVYEKEVVYLINLFQILIIVFAWVIFM